MAIHQFIIEHEAQIRLLSFLSVFILVALWEILSPKRSLTHSKALRWVNNIALVALNTVVLRLLFPAAAIGITVAVQQKGWGLFNQFELPLLFTTIATIILLDFVIYIQHRLVHIVPLLWRLHRVHHADPDYDVTTGARFHPFEIILSMMIKFGAIIIIGPPILGVLLFEIILNGSAMFNHANGRLPLPVDRILRTLIVTPDMHRVHHSVERDETDSNYGFFLSIWDRLFNTYRNQPRAGHKDMEIGIKTYKKASEVIDLRGIITLPFKP